MPRIQLPKDGKALARVLDRHVTREEGKLLARRTMWLLAWYYLNGYRRFDPFIPGQGVVGAHMLDEEGKLEFQSQELLKTINDVAGAIQSADLRPKVEFQGTNLQGMRSRSVAQVVADSLVGEGDVDRVKEEFSWLFTCLGCAGVVGHVVDHPTIGLVGDLEVVHPKELMPFPSLGEDFTRQFGLVRQRMVTLESLKEVYGRRISDHLEEMEWWEIDVGEEWDTEDGFHGPRGMESFTHDGEHRAPRGKGKPTEGYVKLVKFRELWTFGPHRTVETYAATSGEYLVERQDLEGLEVYCPVGVGRFFNNGTFHGAGMFETLFSIHRELEWMLKALFNNIREIDRYGMLILPQGQIDTNTFLRDVGHGLKVGFWEPDFTAEGFNPFPIQPVNSGDIPGRVAQFAREIMGGINPIKDLMAEKGRVDSAAGLQFLDEASQRALTTPSNGVMTAFGTCYKSLLQRATTQLAVSPRAIPVGNLTLDMAGVVIDPEGFDVSFPENPLPNLSRLNVTVRSVSPRSEVARKQEAIQLWERGIETDPMGFRIFALSEGLDFAMWQGEDQGAYESVVRNVLLLYGDGEEPGQVIVTPHVSRPELQLRVLGGFMTGPFMQMASVPVQDAFRMYRMSLMNFLGLTLPAAVPNPDDAAMLSQLMMGGSGGSDVTPTALPGA